jgi:chloramphenicol 3-O phosphotransferase
MFLHVQMDYVFETMEGAGYNGAIQVGQEIPPKLARGSAFVHDGDEFVRIHYGEDARRAFRGFFAMVAGLAGEGNNLVVDAFLEEQWMLESAAKLGALPAYLVGVRCSLDELERRERERGDRFHGSARAFAESVHRYVPSYDVEVDTASSTVEECVRAIVARLESCEPHAFKALPA